MGKLYKLSQPTYRGFDTYDSCVVVANNEEDARLIHPKATHPGDDWWFSSSWVSEDQIHTLDVVELGVAYDHLKSGTVVLASFNAG